MTLLVTTMVCLGLAMARQLSNIQARRIFIDTSKSVMEGGGNFRANFGVEREGRVCWLKMVLALRVSAITTGYPEFDHVFVKKLGWWDQLTEG